MVMVVTSSGIVQLFAFILVWVFLARFLALDYRLFSPNLNHRLYQLIGLCQMTRLTTVITQLPQTIIMSQMIKEVH